MKKFIIAGLGCAFLSSCVPNDTLASLASSEQNVESLARIAVGMKKPHVRRIMGAPYREESFHVQNDNYDVWFYETTVIALAQSTRLHANLTPLTFRGDILVGMGYAYYNWLEKQVAFKIKTTPKSVPASPANPKKDENEQFENDLKKAAKPVPGQPVQPPGSQPTPQQIEAPPAPSTPAPKPTPPKVQKVAPQKMPDTGPDQPVRTEPLKLGPPGEEQKPLPETSMSCTPKSEKPKEKPPQDPKEQSKEEKYEWSEEDQQNIQEEQWEDFNSW